MPQTSDWTQQQLTGLDDSHLTVIQLDKQAVRVQQQVQHDLSALVSHAKQDGFSVAVASGYRDFERQRLIWNNKYLGLRPLLDSQGQPLDANTLSPIQRIHAILRWSALPGASRHHWGSDFDLYAINLLPNNTQLQLEPWEYLSGHQSPFYEWLVTHGAQFGFFFPYAQDQGGVAVEPWHLSHKATATTALNTLTEQRLLDTLQQHPIEGCDEVFKHFNHIYTQYVTNISNL
ncbi:M15 family metallopeptidase [Vibrio rarus]|uniref:M15 family metallopeptidase n=1 Tax=Vibrio rarus TaxID=413403 RepID=UPI0021C379B3|nr:M15 family metallopeptidase [Vibrio rarus]